MYYLFQKNWLTNKYSLIDEFYMEKDAKKEARKIRENARNGDSILLINGDEIYNIEE